MVDLPTDPKPEKLFSWPPNRTLTSFQLLIRCVLFVNDVVGLALGFVTGTTAYFVAGIIAGSFFSVAMFLLLIFISWDIWQLKPKRKTNMFGRRNGYQQLQGDEENSEHNGQDKKATVGVKKLKFTMAMDFLGSLAFLGLYIGMMSEARRGWEWRWRDGDWVMTVSYASVAVLISWILHSALAISEALQLSSAIHARKPTLTQCPVCNHTMREVAKPSVATGALASSAPRQQQRQHEDYLVDDTADAHGESGDGTPATTARHISPQPSPGAGGSSDASASRGRGNSYSTANDDAEGEGDSLIVKG